MEALQKVDNGAMMRYSAKDVMAQMTVIQEVMSQAMKENEHYGVIPGTGNKPTLLKAGAEKLNLLFRLSASYDVQEKELASNHREYIVITTLTHIPTQVVWGQGVGSCSTRESKYRFRNEFVLTGDPIPDDYKDRKEAYKRDGFACRKDENGQWGWYEKKRIENESIEDVYNTVLKMAKKRSLVDAVLTVTAASDCFTQDLEELRDNGVIQEEKAKSQESQENFISNDTWVQICKDAEKCVDPDGKAFSAQHLGNAIKKYMDVKVPSKITHDQMEVIVNVWFFEWERGNWDKVKSNLEGKK